MNVDAGTAAEPAEGWRLKLGVAIFVLSILVPVVGIKIRALFVYSDKVCSKTAQQAE